MTLPADAAEPTEQHTSDQEFRQDRQLGDTVDADNVPHGQHETKD